MIPKTVQKTFARGIYEATFRLCGDERKAVVATTIAAIESAWGTTRWSMESHNWFAIGPDSSRGQVGLPNRPRIRVFDSTADACFSFLWILDTSPLEGYVKARLYPLGTGLWAVPFLKQYDHLNPDYPATYAEMQGFVTEYCVDKLTAPRRALPGEEREEIMAKKMDGKKTYTAGLLGLLFTITHGVLLVRAGDVAGALAAIQEALGAIIASCGFLTALGLRIAISADRKEQRVPVESGPE